MFFLSKGNSTDLRAWCEEHLGMRLEDFGAAILPRQEDKAEDNGLTVWHVADRDSVWFSPSESTFEPVAAHREVSISGRETA